METHSTTSPLSTREAAALCGMSEEYLRDARLRGEVEGSKHGNRIRWEKAAIDAFRFSRRVVVPLTPTVSLSRNAERSLLERAAREAR